MSYPARAEGLFKLFVLDKKFWRIFRRCPWCNGYHRRKWTRWHEFKSWTRLIAFHITLINPWKKEWIQLFSFPLWVNSRADWFLSLGEATRLGEGNHSQFKPVKLSLKIDLVSYPARVDGLLNMDKNIWKRTTVLNYMHSVRTPDIYLCAYKLL